MKANTKLKAIAAALAVAGALGVAQDAIAQAKEIFVPVLVYRTGAYAPNGVPWANGFVDYLKLVNARDGGVNGIKIAYEECETGYATDRGVECYERLKSKKPVAVNPLSTGITFALTEKVPNDKIVLMTTGYGRADLCRRLSLQRGSAKMRFSISQQTQSEACNEWCDQPGCRGARARAPARYG